MTEYIFTQTSLWTQICSDLDCLSRSANVPSQNIWSDRIATFRVMDSLFRRNRGEHMRPPTRVTRKTILRPGADGDPSEPDGPPASGNSTDFRARERRRTAYFRNAPEDIRKVGSIKAHWGKGKTTSSSTRYELGDIVRLPHMVPCLKEHAELGSYSIGWTQDAGPIVAKMRPAVVVGIYDHGLTCIPMQSNQGLGPHPNEEEYSIWLRAPTDERNIWRDVDEIDYLLTTSMGVVTSSHLHIGRAYPAMYQWPISKIGKLSAKSFERLRRLWMIHIKRGFLRPHEQHEYVATERALIPFDDEFRITRVARLAQEAIERQTASRPRPASIPQTQPQTVSRVRPQTVSRAQPQAAARVQSQAVSQVQPEADRPRNAPIVDEDGFQLVTRSHQAGRQQQRPQSQRQPQRQQTQQQPPQGQQETSTAPTTAPQGQQAPTWVLPSTQQATAPPPSGRPQTTFRRRNPPRQSRNQTSSSGPGP